MMPSDNNFVVLFTSCKFVYENFHRTIDKKKVYLMEVCFWQFSLNNWPKIKWGRDMKWRNSNLLWLMPQPREIGE